MPRINRIEAANYPYHIVHRGNRRQKVFIKSSDKDLYLQILGLQAKFYRLEVWAYCLMDNHVHLIVCPRLKDSLTVCISEAHRQYTRMVNFREGWRGHLWQGRFKSFPLDEKYLFAAVKYVERNPVRARLVLNAEDFGHSSAKAHIKKEKNEILSDFHLIQQISDWGKYLEDDDSHEHILGLRKNHRRGQAPFRGQGKKIRQNWADLACLKLCGT